MPYTKAEIVQPKHDRGGRFVTVKPIENTGGELRFHGADPDPVQVWSFFRILRCKIQIHAVVRFTPMRVMCQQDSALTSNLRKRWSTLV